MRALAFILALAPALAAGGTFVSGNSTLPGPKVDAKACSNPDPNKCLTAADFNALRNAAFDLRTAHDQHVTRLDALDAAILPLTARPSCASGLYSDDGAGGFRCVPAAVCEEDQRSIFRGPAAGWVCAPTLNVTGTGWTGSTSLTDYPKTGSVTTCYGAETGCIVDLDDGLGGKTPAQRLTDALALLSTKTRVLLRNNSGATVTLTAGVSRNLGTPWTVTKQVFAYGTQRIKLDASGIGAVIALKFNSGLEHWKGLEIVGSTYSGGYVVQLNGSTGVKFEDAWIHDNPGSDGRAPTGLQMWAGGGHIVQDVLVWNSVVGGTTNSGDGFAATGGSSNNRIVRCFASHPGDDGFDLYNASNTQIIDSVAVSAAKNLDGSPNTGDGNGFKMGGTATNPSGNVLSGSIAYNCLADGITWNSQPGPTTVRHCTSYANNRGIALGGTGSIATDSIAYGNTSLNLSGSSFAENLRNSWLLGNADPLFSASGTGDYSLLPTSPYAAAGQGATALGASTIAIQILKDNWSRR